MIKERYEALDTAITCQLRRSSEIRYYYGDNPQRQALENMLAGKEGNRIEQEARLWMSTEIVKFADMVKKYEDLCIQLDYWDRGDTDDGASMGRRPGREEKARESGQAYDENKTRQASIGQTSGSVTQSSMAGL